LPLSQDEHQAFPGAPKDLWTSLLTGGYPRIPDQGIEPGVWLGDYTRTYVERDVRQLLQISNLRTFTTFLSLVAGRTGQDLNATNLSSDTGVSVNTIRAWLSVLEASYLITLVPAWHPNHRKQHIKSPKLHFLDSGLACHLLGIQTAPQLATHPLRGALFESWVVSEVMKARLHAGFPARIFHYREAKGPEVDLLVQSEAGWVLTEAKSGATVDTSFFRNMEALASQFPEGNPVERRLIYGGKDSYQRQGVAVTGWPQIQERAW
jgi:predicted AAA+ superfamily ATPase